MINGDSWGFNGDSFHGDSWWGSPLSIYAVNQQNWMINGQKWGWTTIFKGIKPATIGIYNILYIYISNNSWVSPRMAITQSRILRARFLSMQECLKMLWKLINPLWSFECHFLHPHIILLAIPITCFVVSHNFVEDQIRFCTIKWYLSRWFNSSFSDGYSI